MGWTTGVQFLVGLGFFSLCHHVQTGLGAHSPSYPVDTGGSLPSGKVIGAWSWPQASI